jgi:hypothetical protein
MGRNKQTKGTLDAVLPIKQFQSAVSWELEEFSPASGIEISGWGGAGGAVQTECKEEEMKTRLCV